MIEAVGVDVGGTKVSVALFRDGSLVEAEVVPTERGSAEALIDEIVARVERARSDRTEAVGLGVPSVVEFASGRLRTSVNVPFRDLPLRELLTERVGLPVFVDNDATVAALAEAWEGEGVAIENLVMFTVGTGVGGGLVLGGRPYRGATGAAGEVGHTLIGLELTDGAPSPAGRAPHPGSLESLAAGRELDRLAAAAAAARPESALGMAAAAGEEVGGEEAVAAAKDGDPVAIELLRVLGGRLGIGIANAINLLDPDVVAIGGGVSTAGDLLLEPAREAALAYLLPGVGVETEIRLAHSGPDAGVLGAALLAVCEHRGRY